MPWAAERAKAAAMRACAAAGICAALAAALQCRRPAAEMVRALIDAQLWRSMPPTSMMRQLVDRVHARRSTDRAADYSGARRAISTTSRPILCDLACETSGLENVNSRDSTSSFVRVD